MSATTTMLVIGVCIGVLIMLLVTGIIWAQIHSSVKVTERHLIERMDSLQARLRRLEQSTNPRRYPRV